MKAKLYHIFVRVIARSVDGVIATILVFGVLYILEMPLDAVNEVLYPVVFLGAWLFLEALLLASWGTTPGKYFLSVTVMKAEGQKLGMKGALLRSLFLYTEGNVFGLPYAIVVAWVANLIVFFVTGQTLYDRHGSFGVNTDHVRKWRLVLVTLILAIVAVVGLFSGYEVNEPGPYYINEVYKL